jgi:ribose transport system ATP-binding protein
MLDIRELSKTFDTTRVLDRVAFTLRGGEIRALMGENGSGKSTMIKILAGYHEPDRDARVELRGSSLTFPLKPGESGRLGMCFVHQDLGLVNAGTVVENLFVGQFQTGRARRIRWRSEIERAREALDRFGLTNVDPVQQVGTLDAADRASLAIVRATYSLTSGSGRPEAGRKGLLVLDETTSFLPDDGVNRVLDTVRKVRDEGNAVLFVSHRLEEVFALCDSVTVLRDGRVVMSQDLAETSREDLVRAMTGGRVGMPVMSETGPRDARSRPDTDETALVVTDLVCGPVGPVSFDLRRGEVVGLTGLLGSGFELLPYGLFGAASASGRVGIADRSVPLSKLNPASAMRLGFGLVPADRMGHGGIGSASVADNITMLALNRKGRFSPVSDRAQSTTTAQAIRRFDIRPDRPTMEFAHLSGGNQQKAIIAKWSGFTASVLLIHEPTRGVDIAAKQQILAAIRELAVAGRAILMASADCGDLASVCDRVLIVSLGRIRRTMTGDELTEQRIQAAIHG